MLEKRYVGTITDVCPQSMKQQSITIEMVEQPGFEGKKAVSMKCDIMYDYECDPKLCPLYSKKSLLGA